MKKNALIILLLIFVLTYNSCNELSQKQEQNQEQEVKSLKHLFSEIETQIKDSLSQEQEIKNLKQLFSEIEIKFMELRGHLSRKKEAQTLAQFFSEIQIMASTVTCCIDSSVWTFISYGDGPVGYIAYSTKIDTSLFIKKIKEHRIAQREFNIKWQIDSNCSIVKQPTGLICVDGKPVLEYLKK